jgi:uncharacterized protein YbjT (DUF2867 family)
MSAPYPSKPLRLTIVTETDGLGGRLLERALAAGHRVTAVVRDPAELSRLLLPLFVRQSSGMPVRVAVAGGGPGRVGAVNHDESEYRVPAVCVAATDLGAPDAELLELAIEGADAVVSALEVGVARRGTRAIVGAMRVAGVRRLLVVAPVLAGDGASEGARSGDRESVQDVLDASELEWTIVRPPELTDGPSGRRDDASHIDLAHLVLRALEQPHTVRRTIGAAR